METYVKIHQVLTMSMKNKDNSKKCTDIYFPTDYVKESEIIKLLAIIKRSEMVINMDLASISVVKTDKTLPQGEVHILTWKIDLYDVGTENCVYRGKIGGYPSFAYDVKIINDYFLKRNVVEEVNKCKKVLEDFIKNQTSYDNIKNYETILRTLTNWS